MAASANIDAFDALYEEYEQLSRENAVDISRRHVIRRFVEDNLSPKSEFLELNAGSGIDALYFARKGHNVLATDISRGSEAFINRKIAKHRHLQLRFQHCDFSDLSEINGTFDHIFSNFGGLNCTGDLSAVFDQLTRLVNPGGYVTLVVMPKWYPWEILSIVKGNKNAFRRFKKGGTTAQIGNESVHVHYHSPSAVKSAFPKSFEHVKTINIGTFYPSGHFRFLDRFPMILRALIKIDGKINRLGIMPKGIGDYFIITFKKKADD